MDLQELLGEELYNQVVEKAGDNKIAVVSDGSYIPKQKFDDLNHEMKQYKQQVADRDSQIDDLQKKAGNNEDMQETINELKENNRQEVERLKQEKHDQQYNYELEKGLIASKAKNPKALKGLLDTEMLKLDDDGEIRGLSEQLEKIKESDAYLFDDAPENDDSQPDTTGKPVDYKAGGSRKTNNPSKGNTRDAGKQRAMERYGINKEE